MQNILKPLCDEHQNILKMIEALLKECAALEDSGKINAAFFQNAIDFVRNYADKFHHAKEEDILFAELCKDTVKMHCNPVRQMLYEHNLGRDFIKRLEEALMRQDKNEIIINARGYTDLLREHIYKEDNILYPMADETLSAEIQRQISDKFQQIEQKFAPQNKKYLSFINEPAKA